MRIEILDSAFLSFDRNSARAIFEMKLTRIIIIGSVLILCNLLFVYAEESPSVEFKFSSDVCKMSMPLPDSEAGVQKVNWHDNNKLEIKAFVNENCADWIEGGDVEVHDNTIALKYIVGYTIQFGERLSANCICPYQLNYTFTNLDKKDYQFKLEALDTKKPKLYRER
ncbi:MAG: hypothetical protein KKF80_06650 [Candidatus Omnitrophica bacterium]|nr:hypothetical protein [Candidatus Omnitrophota bacterium]